MLIIFFGSYTLGVIFLIKLEVCSCDLSCIIKFDYKLVFAYRI